MIIKSLENRDSYDTKKAIREYNEELDKFIKDVNWSKINTDRIIHSGDIFSAKGQLYDLKNKFDVLYTMMDRVFYCYMNDMEDALEEE